MSAMISEHGKSVDTIDEIFYYYAPLYQSVLDFCSTSATRKTVTRIYFRGCLGTTQPGPKGQGGVEFLGWGRPAPPHQL